MSIKGHVVDHVKSASTLTSSRTLDFFYHIVTISHTRVIKKFSEATKSDPKGARGYGVCAKNLVLFFRLVITKQIFFGDAGITHHLLEIIIVPARALS